MSDTPDGAKWQPEFLYFECQDCGFDSVQPVTFKGSDICPLCAGDSGHSVTMRRRMALSTDLPEGRDARLFSDPRVAPTVPDSGGAK